MSLNIFFILNCSIHGILSQFSFPRYSNTKRGAKAIKNRKYSILKILITKSIIIAITNNNVIDNLINIIITVSTQELLTLLVIIKSCILITEDHK